MPPMPPSNIQTDATQSPPKLSPPRSEYVGVTWDGQMRKWKARKQKDGKLKHLGYYENEKDAARAYDTAAGECGITKVNFPKDDTQSQATKRAKKRNLKAMQHVGKRTSAFVGVYWNVRMQKWQAKIRMIWYKTIRI